MSFPTIQTLSILSPFQEPPAEVKKVSFIPSFLIQLLSSTLLTGHGFNHFSYDRMSNSKILNRYDKVEHLRPQRTEWTIRVRAQAVWIGINRETQDFRGFNVIFIDDSVRFAQFITGSVNLPPFIVNNRPFICKTLLCQM